MMFEIDMVGTDAIVTDTNATDTTSTTIDMTKYIAKQRDALRGTAANKLVTVHNTSMALQTDRDDDSDEDNDTDDHNNSEQMHSWTTDKKQEGVQRTTEDKGNDGEGKFAATSIIVLRSMVRQSGVQLHWDVYWKQGGVACRRRRRQTITTTTTINALHDKHNHDNARADNQQGGSGHVSAFAMMMMRQQLMHTTIWFKRRQPTTTLVLTTFSASGNQRLHCRRPRVDHHLWEIFPHLVFLGPRSLRTAANRFSRLTTAGGGPLTWTPDVECYVSYMPNFYSSPKRQQQSNNRFMNGQVAAFGTDPQGSWAGVWGTELWEGDPDSAKYMVKGQRDRSREPKHPLCLPAAANAGASQLVSAPAAWIASCRRACARPGDGATPGPSVVSPDDASSTEPAFFGWSPVHPSIGYRELPVERCHQHTFSVHLSPRGPLCPEEVEAIVSSIFGQLRGGKARSLQGSRPHLRSTLQNHQPSKSTRPPSQGPSSEFNCPDGFQIYKKEVKQFYHQNGQTRVFVNMDGGQLFSCPKGKWIGAPDQAMGNLTFKNEGGCPTGFAPTPRADFARHKFRTFVHKVDARANDPRDGNQAEIVKKKTYQNKETYQQNSDEENQEFDGKPGSHQNWRGPAWEVVNGKVYRFEGTIAEARVREVKANGREETEAVNRVKMEHAEARARADEVFEGPVGGSQHCDHEMSIRKSQGLETFNDHHCEDEPVYQENHVMEDHDVIRHAIGNHEVSQGHVGEADQDEVEQDFVQEEGEKNGERLPSCRTGKEEPTCDDNHVRNDCDAQGHKIGIHEIDQYHRGETKPIAVGQGKPQDGSQSGKGEVEDGNHYPWFFARVVCYWLGKMRKHNVLHWNIDDYDGDVSYQEGEMQALKQYEADEETRAEHYHQMRAELVCREGGNEEACYEVNSEMQRGKMNDTIEEIINLGQCHYHLAKERTRNGVRAAHEREDKHQSKVDAQLACFTKGKRNRRPIGTSCREEEFDEVVDNMVCPMAGQQWEQLFYPHYY